jgi:hypothetical protein
VTWERAKNTKERLLTPRPCRTCGRMMPLEFLVEREKQRRKNISNALNGSDVERSSTVSRPEVRRLRALGWTIRRIAAQLNCSTWAVHRACKPEAAKAAAAKDKL